MFPVYAEVWALFLSTSQAAEPGVPASPSMLGELFINPVVQGMLQLLVLAIGGYLIKLFARLGDRLTEIAAATTINTTEVRAVAETATKVAETTIKTEVLVNSKWSELREEIREVRTQLIASQNNERIAAETAAKVATQTVKDLQAVKDMAAAQALIPQPAPTAAPLPANISFTVQQPPGAVGTGAGGLPVTVVGEDPVEVVVITPEDERHQSPPAPKAPAG